MFKVGDLIKWFLIYDVGMVKDGGIGIILDVFDYNFGEYETSTYKVFRTEHSDIMIFEHFAIEKFKE